jgi:hypothetical protein
MEVPEMDFLKSIGRGFPVFFLSPAVAVPPTEFQLNLLAGTQEFFQPPFSHPLDFQILGSNFSLANVMLTTTDGSPLSVTPVSDSFSTLWCALPVTVLLAVRTRWTSTGHTDYSSGNRVPVPFHLLVACVADGLAKLF